MTFRSGIESRSARLRLDLITVLERSSVDISKSGDRRNGSRSLELFFPGIALKKS